MVAAGSRGMTSQRRQQNEVASRRSRGTSSRAGSAAVGRQQKCRNPRDRRPEREQIALTAAGVDVIIGLGEPSANLISGVVELIPLGRKLFVWCRCVPASVEAQVTASALEIDL